MGGVPRGRCSQMTTPSEKNHYLMSLARNVLVSGLVAEVTEPGALKPMQLQLPDGLCWTLGQPGEQHEQQQQCSNPACGNPSGRWLALSWFVGTSKQGRPTIFKTCSRCRAVDAEKKRKKRNIAQTEQVSRNMRITDLENELAYLQQSHSELQTTHSEALRIIQTLKAENYALRFGEEPSASAGAAAIKKVFVLPQKRARTGWSLESSPVFPAAKSDDIPAVPAEQDEDLVFEVNIEDCTLPAPVF